MVPPGADNDRSDASRLPQPPFSVDLLADLHADALPPDVADHVRSHLPDDPHARSVLAALDRTTAVLRDAPPDPVSLPPAVAARTTDTLDRISADVAAAGGHTAVPLTRPDRGDAKRSRRLAVAGLVGAATVAVVVAVSVGLFRSPAPQEPAQQAQPTAPSATSGPGERMAMLSVLGRDDAAPFGSEAELRRCTAANDVPEGTAVVGSGPVTLRDRPAAVILLATGVAGVFDALVVGPDCTTGNPSTISRTLIGN
ncbi:hypothetical protein VZC37_16350 [Gordonia sp. LSe1-13]|uniref:Anti-sigma-M factor RsmA n=1 Tax=Gordonia sesuvii TaxID=3116777 RepID=A0ABU7MFL9_9ACTN|nr:hypothetical protein [Gordonia sp. LSe1-13]